MDPIILQELLKQFGLTSVFVALAVSLVVTSILGVAVFYVNQQSERRRETQLERFRTNMEKELATFKAREIKEIENVQQAKWELKHQACLDALEVVDSFLSHTVAGQNGTLPVRQPADTIRARVCYNRLVLTCQKPEVTEAFIKVMFPAQSPDMALITDNLNALRNAIREELGFGQVIKLSRDVAWFVRLAGDSRENSKLTIESETPESRTRK